MKESTPTTTSRIGMMKNILAIFSLAFPLNKARNSAPKERIAPGKLGSCVPPNAEPMIKMLKTIIKFSMKLPFFFCLQKSNIRGTWQVSI